jgi:hypothetical protein
LKSVSVLTVHVLPTNKNENKNEIKVTREVDEKKISIITQYFEQPSLLQKWFSSTVFSPPHLLKLLVTIY